MKILFVSNSLNGLFHFRMDVMMHLKSIGYEVVGVVPSSDRNKLDVNGLKILYVPLHRTSKNFYHDLSFFFSLLRVFISEKPDYVFNYTVKPNIYATLAARLFRVSSSMMMAGLGYPFSNNNLSSKLARGLYRVALNFSDNLLLLNESNVESVKRLELCNSEKIIFLEGGEGVNLQRFQYHDNLSDKVCFIFVGRLLREKGVLDFLEAAGEIKRLYPKVGFQIAGSADIHSPCSLKPEEIEAIKTSDVVDYLGYIDMAKKLEDAGIVLVIPSYYPEGLNRSLMEGCAAGKPIITTNQPGCRELVVDGVNGFLVPVQRPKVLADAMLRYISLPDDKKRCMSIESRRLAESRFNVENVYRIYESILERAVKKQ